MSRFKFSKLHSKKRAFERYGVDISNDDIHGIEKKIRAGKSIFIKRKSNRVAEHEVNFKGQRFRLLYDGINGHVLTFLSAKGGSNGDEPTNGETKPE